MHELTPFYLLFQLKRNKDLINTNTKENKMETKQSVYQSRYGFHSCSYETFLKLKKLKKLYFQALRRYAEHKRWVRKAPQNRVIREYLFDKQKRRIGHVIKGPRPEPVLYPVFEQKWYGLSDMKILENFEIARHPYKTAEETVPLSLKIEEIDEMLASLSQFV